MGAYLDGKDCARSVYGRLEPEIERFHGRRGRPPRLGVILAGHHDASEIYVRNKRRRADEIGIDVELIRFPDETTTTAIVDMVASLNARDDIDAILVQTPLPSLVDQEAVTLAVDPAKDADGFHPVNLGLLAGGGRPTAVPCTPAGCLELVRRAGVDPSGKHAVVVGRSAIVGRPAALILLGADATVSICHSKTADLGEITRQGDILIAAAGRRHLITPSMVKPGAAVLDVGMNRNEDGSLAGDVDPGVLDVAAFLTPVPGGVGPMTIAMLMANTVALAARRSA